MNVHLRRRVVPAGPLVEVPKLEQPLLLRRPRQIFSVDTSQADIQSSPSDFCAKRLSPRYAQPQRERQSWLKRNIMLSF